jgi:Mor family transcriptional regulator
MNFLPLYAVLPPKLHPTLREVVECLYAVLADMPALGETVGARETLAAEIARMQVVALAKQSGGSALYLPKNLPGLLLSIRDREIWSKFTGHNLHALAREYNLSDMRVSQIIATCREAEREARQGKLPGVDV